MSFSDSKLSPTPIFAEDLLSASCPQEAIKAAGVFGSVGLFYSTAASWWVQVPRSVMFRNQFNKTSLFAGLGAICYGATCSVSHLRNSDDFLNAAIGGATTGFVFGMKGGTVPKMVYHTLIFGLVCGLCDWAERSAKYRDSFSSEIDRKEERVRSFLAWKPRDPYAERWKAIQEREQQ